MQIAMPNLRETFSEISQAIPVHLLATAGVNVSMPIWYVYVKHASEIAADLAPIVALAALVFSVWRAFRDDGKKTSSSRIIKAAGATFKTGAKLGAWGLVIGILTLGIALLFTKRADASPALPASQTTAARKRTSATRKKSADDAGDDGETEEDEPIGKVPPWYPVAREDIGLREKLPNGKSNAVVGRMYLKSGYKKVQDARAVPWCMVWINDVLDRSGHKGTGRPNARSVLDHPDFRKVEKPFVGCVGVTWRGSADDGVTGHVWFYAGETDTHWKCLGANQQDSVNVALIAKLRKDKYGRTKPTLLGFRAPKLWYHDKSKVAVATAAVGSVGTAGVAVSEAVNAPAPVAAPTTGTQIAETVDAIKGPAENIANALPDGSRMKLYIIAGIALLVTAAALFVIYERHKKP